MEDQFKIDLQSLSCAQIFRRHVLSGEPRIIGVTELFELREKISDFLGVEFSEVVLVGSAQSGFSIKPQRRYQKFGDNSDLDFAIVSPQIFEKVWKEAHEYRYSGAYWPGKSDFFRYVARGWVRPDKLPKSEIFRLGNEWWDFFRLLSKHSAANGYRLNAGLYQSWFFLESYQKAAIQQCIDERSCDENVSHEPTT